MLINEIAACKHSPYPDRCSCRFYRDFCSHFGWHCWWCAHVQPLVPHCAICCHNWSADAWWNTTAPIVRPNGLYRLRIIRTNCSATCSSSVWHRSCPTGSSIWWPQSSVFRCFHSLWAHFSVSNRFRLVCLKHFAVFNWWQFICILFSVAGVAPPSFLAIQAGQTLNTMTSSSDAFSIKSMLLLGVFSLFTLVPVIFKNQIKKKIQWIDRYYVCRFHC